LGGEHSGTRGAGNGVRNGANDVISWMGIEPQKSMWLRKIHATARTLGTPVSLHLPPSHGSRGPCPSGGSVVSTGQPIGVGLLSSDDTQRHHGEGGGRDGEAAAERSREGRQRGTYRSTSTGPPARDGRGREEWGDRKLHRAARSRTGATHSKRRNGAAAGTWPPGRHPPPGRGVPTPCHLPPPQLQPRNDTHPLLYLSVERRFA